MHVKPLVRSLFLCVVVAGFVAACAGANVTKSDPRPRRALPSSTAEDSEDSSESDEKFSSPQHRRAVERARQRDPFYGR